MKQYIYKFTLAIAVALSMSNFYCAAMEKEPFSEDHILGPICTLSLEMEEKICSFLSSPADLSSMSQVSQDWNVVLKSVYDRSKNTFVIGGLGSGVSTLALLIAGKELSVGLDMNSDQCLFKCSDNHLGITIAHGFSTGTSKHTYIYTDGIGKIWDCSSFCKDRFDPEVDFSKAQNLQSLLSGPVKVIIAIQEPYQLHGWHAVGTPMDILNRVAEMFMDLDQLKKIATLVITKTKPRCRFTYTEMLQAFLTIEGRYAGKYTKNFTGLLTYFLNNPDKVITFPEPTHSGPYVISEQLRSLINDRTFVLNPSINAPTLAAIQEDRWFETLEGYYKRQNRNVGL